MWVSISTIFVAYCYGVSAEEEQRTESLYSANDNSYARTNRGDGASSQDGDFRQGSQNSFYPSYSPYDSPPLGHSRPSHFTNQQEGAYSQRSQPYQNSFDSSERYSGYKDDYSPPKSDHQSLLGSGNFGVITGGTFYSDNEGEHSNHEDYSSYFHNGHGRPSFYYSSPSNPKAYSEDQFANFRDFADINTPSDRQYSHYVIVYVPNKNSTREENYEGNRKVPKNIMESLTMLDLESTGEEIVPQKKLSKSKRKLALIQPEKKYLQKKVKPVRDPEEPLMALS